MTETGHVIWLTVSPSIKTIESLTFTGEDVQRRARGATYHAIPFKNPGLVLAGGDVVTRHGRRGELNGVVVRRKRIGRRLCLGG